MIWMWILLLLAVECNSSESDDDDEDPAIQFHISTRYLEAEKPFFSFSSSLWNEYLKREVYQHKQPALPR